MSSFSEKYDGSVLPMQQAVQELAADKSIILVDVRAPSEYRTGHIPGSINLPLETLRQTAPGKLTDQAQRLFVYCYSGVRSSSACTVLKALGYTDVVNIGGIAAWRGEIETE